MYLGLYLLFGLLLYILMLNVFPKEFDIQIEKLEQDIWNQYKLETDEIHTEEKARKVTHVVTVVSYHIWMSLLFMVAGIPLLLASIVIAMNRNK